VDPLFRHQQIAVDLLSRNNVFALIMEQGTGKSRPVIEDWLARVEDNTADDLIVIAPKGCYMNWIGTEEEPGELEKWIPPEVLQYIHIVPWISGGNKAQRVALDEALHVTKPRFLAMNIEALNRPGKARDYLLKFIANRKVIGVIDESTTIAHESAARTEFILDKLAQCFVVRRILTGLVAPESPLDLYTQYCFLDWKIIGQKSFWGFKNRYAIMEKIDFRPMAQRIEDSKEKKPFRMASKTVGFRNLEELNQKIMKSSYRVTKDQVLDLPPKIYQFWDVDLTEEQGKIYRQMRDIAMAELRNGEFSTAKMKLDQLGKLQHILCGHVRKEDGTLADIPENRTDAVAEILHNHTGKAIVWAPYPQALRKITARLRKEFGDDSTVTFWGETSLDDRLEARGRIQSDALCRFIVSNQSIGKFGNTWTACNLVIYYANSFDNEDRQQSEDRAHRIGQTKFVTYIDLRAKGTLDERLIKVLRKKINMASTLQGDQFKEWLI
jgi:SNF2-related domain